ncbi:hypothetical protein [Micromonospora sp. CB01531]|uniref:hypothetical protein n=1 Tax=Micromonospora sp. CB01531 TaxID=1718947 RepID=UPI001161286A|nr:hypothetical protein [Micromonospora sp. CB01531]
MVTSRGSATWQKGDLEFIAWLEEDPVGLVKAVMNVGDARLGPLMDEFGRMAMRLRLRLRGIPWPARKVLEDQEVSYFQKVISAEQDFLKGRRGLINVLASESEVVRGDIYAWQDKCSYVGRRVQALILAEDAGEQALASRLRESLKASTKQSPGGPPVLFQARRWADEYAKKVNRKVVIWRRSSSEPLAPDSRVANRFGFCYAVFPSW